MSELLVVETKFAQWNRIREKLVAEFSAHDAQGQALEKELQELDPRLIVRFIENVPDDHPMRLGIKANRWHIIRKGENDNELDHYLPILGPNFEYRAPEMKVAEDMKKADLWKEGALENLFRERERQTRVKQAESDLKREQLRDEMALAYRSAKRVKGDEKLLKEKAH